MSAVDLHARPSADHAERVARSVALLARAAADHAPLVQASSLGAEDMVVTHLLASAGIPAGIFVLHTLRLHEETLALMPRIEAQYGRTVQVYRPDAQAVAAYERAHGADAIYQSQALRKQCCDIRKMEPLRRALAGCGGWITGLRREQSNARAEVPDLELETVDGATRAKVNPLAAWTWGDVWHFIGEHRIPYNPLHDQFFPSIGCAPCTRAVTLGEDFRAGRWWWEQASAKECGLHVKPVIAIQEAA